MQPDGFRGSSIQYGNNQEVGHVQSDGERNYYKVYGEGESILVLHGGGIIPLVLNALLKLEFIDNLSPNCCVIDISK